MLRTWNALIVFVFVGLFGFHFAAGAALAADTPDKFTIEGARTSSKSSNGKPVLVLIWDPLGKDLVYHVELSDTKDFKKILFQADTKGNTSIAGVVAFPVNDAELEPNKTYFFRVSVPKPDGTRIIAMPVGPGADTITFRSLLPEGLHLQKSFSNKQLADGAVFSYSKPSSSNAAETYSADFALVYKPTSELTDFHFIPDRGNRFERDHVGIFGVVEGHVSSDPSPKVSEHNFIAQIGFDDFIKWSPQASEVFNSFYTYSTASVRYESSQSGDVQKALASLRVFPTFEPIAAGREKTLPNWRAYDGDKSSVGFIHEESFGVDAGGTTHGRGNSALESDSSVFRLVAHIRPELRLNFLKSFVPKGVSLYGDETLNYLVTSRRPANFFQAGVNLQFTDNVGMQFFYKVGEAAPQFKKVESINVGLSVKF
jgi:hypothetical protein